METAIDVGPALLPTLGRDLRGSVLGAGQQLLPQRKSGGPGNPFCQQFRLIVTSLAEPARVQRHGNDKLSGYLVGHKMFAHDSTQLGSSCPQIPVFEPVDRSPHYPIQDEWRPNPVNCQGNGPAGSAGRFYPWLAAQPAKGRSQLGKFLQARRAENFALF